MNQPAPTHPDDLLGVTYDFLAELPPEIRNNILYFVLMYALDRELGPDDKDPMAILDASVKDKSASKIRRIGLMVRLAASIDLVLPRDIKMGIENETRLPAMLATEGLSDNIKAILERQIADREPNLRHAQAAYEKWKMLRAGPLSLGSMADYEDRMMRPG